MKLNHFKLLLVLIINTVILSSIGSVVAETNNSAKNKTQQMVESLKLRLSRQASSTFNQWRPVKKVVIWGNQSTSERFKQQFPNLEIVHGNDIAFVREALNDADVFIGYCIPQLLQDDLKLAWIHSMAVGVENCINSEAIQKLAPTVTNAQRLSGPEIAEHAIGLMFSLVRRLDQYSLAQQRQQWERGLAPGDDKIWEIAGKTMLVVG